MKLARVLVVFMFLFGLFTPLSQAQAAVRVRSKGVTPKGLLNADGTLRLDGSAKGSIDLSGYRVQLDLQRGPVFDLANATAQTTAVATVGKWAAVGDGGGVLDGTVLGIAVHGTDVYVAGSFTNAANIPEAEYVAKWNGTSWSALGSNGAGDGAIDTYCYTVAVDSGGNVSVGGYFFAVNDNGTLLSAAGKIAEWSGTDWRRDPDPAALQAGRQQ